MRKEKVGKGTVETCQELRGGPHAVRKPIGCGALLGKMYTKWLNILCESIFWKAPPK